MIDFSRSLLRFFSKFEKKVKFGIRSGIEGQKNSTAKIFPQLFTVLKLKRYKSNLFTFDALYYMTYFPLESLSFNKGKLYHFSH